MLSGNQLYNQIIAKGLAVSHWQSDLYVKVMPESTALIERYELKANIKTFKSAIDNELWYEIPFCYMPFWNG